MTETRRTPVLKLAISALLALLMFMATVSWVTESVCPLMKLFTTFVHRWYTALPIDVVGGYVFWRFWFRPIH